MLKYAICEIKGKQFCIEPGKPINVSALGGGDKVEVKVLLAKKDDTLEIGKPYLEEKIQLEVVKNFRGEKIKVYRYHSKANYRRVKGYRSELSSVVLPVKT